MAAQLKAAHPRRVSVLVVAAVALATAGAWLRGGSPSCSSRDAVQEVDLPTAFLGGGTSTVKKIVTESFPGVMKGSVAMSKVLKALRPYGVRGHNSIYGMSVSPDEINGDSGHLTTLLAKHFGHAVNLGGLAGVPFVGKTGFGTLAQQAPDGGHVVIVFGPHIGYTLEGEPGKFLRKRQAATSAACGASGAAYAQNMGKMMRSDYQDAQQSWLRAKLKTVHEEITMAPDPTVELVMQVYQIIEKEVMDIVNTDFGTGNLVLVGGVTVNMPYPMEGWFLPLHFSVQSADQEPVDLLALL